jgi:two-component system phosphate regulon sensor histidine kinase PhoR
MRDLMATLGVDLAQPISGAPQKALPDQFALGTDANGAPIELPLRRILAGETLTGDHTVDLQVHTPDGRDLYLNISGAPIRGSDGSILGAVESLRDVTSKRENEQERSRTMNLVAHELRTPLTAIKLSIDLSLRRASRGLPIEAATLDVAATSCVQLERMVSDLVDAARAERKNMEMEFAPCDMGELTAQAVVEQEATTNKPIHFDQPRMALPIFADATRIHQVLSNLLSNAVKYSPPDAPITVRAERRDGSVWVGVSDEGPGVSVEAAPHLFEPFYRAPDVAKQPGAQSGLGLGLFLCKRIVDLHSGHIDMQNNPERGSLFWFTLPLAESDHAP